MTFDLQIMNWSILLPLLGVGVGWILNELEHVFRLRLDELITDLAWKHSWRSWLNVRGHPKAPLAEMPPEIIESMKRGRPPAKQ